MPKETNHGIARMSPAAPVRTNQKWRTNFNFLSKHVKLAKATKA